MVDTKDLKSFGSNPVSVRVRPRAFKGLRPLKIPAKGVRPSGLPRSVFDYPLSQDKDESAARLSGLVRHEVDIN